MTSTVNVELLSQTLAHIEANPHDWDQSQWRCGTSRCFAGWASWLAGGRFISSEHSGTTLVVTDGSKQPRRSVVRTNTGELMHVADHAERELGLPRDNCLYSSDDRLFSSDNTLDDLRRMVHNLIEWGDYDDPNDHPDPIKIADPYAHEEDSDESEDDEPDPDVARDIALDHELGVC